MLTDSLAITSLRLISPKKSSSKFILSLERYRPEYKFSTWIYKIAHNAAIDHLRRNSGARGLEPLTLEVTNGASFERPLATGMLTPEQASERSEWRAEIETVVQLLPAAYRELIVLRHSHDLNYDEIAEITNLPLGTVKNRIFRAREMMREQFERRGITSAYPGS
ncbi:MAG: sigma-70 family RNA polymerase sigma factor [Pyrinomonadaceae bacterium]